MTDNDTPIIVAADVFAIREAHAKILREAELKAAALSRAAAHMTDFLESQGFLYDVAVAHTGVIKAADLTLEAFLAASSAARCCDSSVLR